MTDYIGWLITRQHKHIPTLCRLNNFSQDVADDIIKLIYQPEYTGMTDIRNDYDMVGFCVYEPHPTEVTVKYVICHPEYYYDRLMDRLCEKLTPTKNKLKIYFKNNDTGYENYELARVLKQRNFICNYGIGVKYDNSIRQ